MYFIGETQILFRKFVKFSIFPKIFLSTCSAWKMNPWGRIPVCERQRKLLFSLKNSSNFVTGLICLKSTEFPKKFSLRIQRVHRHSRFWNHSRKIFQLSLSEIKRFIKIRNHDVFHNLNYIFIYFLTSGSDNSKLGDFLDDFKNGCGDGHAESVEKENFGNSVDFKQISPVTKFDEFFKEKSNFRWHTGIRPHGFIFHAEQVDRIIFEKIESFTNFRNNIWLR